MPSDAPKSLILRDEEVRAVLAGRATVRRKLKIPAKMLREWNEGASFVPGCVRETRTAHEVLVHFAGDHGWDVVSCPLGAVGERRRVREAWRPWAIPVYRADQPDEFAHYYYPATHMKASESRLTVEIISVRVERAGDAWEWVVEIERCDRAR